MKYKKHSGSALVEYAIPTALLTVTMIAFAANGDFMNDMQTLTANTLNGGSGGSGTVMIQSYGARDSGQQLSATLDLLGYQGNTAEVTFPGKNGPIVIQNFPTQLSDNIDTLGVNGTTRILSQTMGLIADELLKQGEIDLAQANLLKDLANKGYQIAEVQELIENAAANSPNDTEFYDWNFRHDGEDYRSPKELLENTIGIEANVPLLGTQQTQARGTYVGEFNQLFLQAEANDTLMQNPAVRDLITSLSTDIMQTTLATNETMQAVDLFEIKPEKFTTDAASNVTNFDSTGICGTGGGVADAGGGCS